MPTNKAEVDALRKSLWIYSPNAKIKWNKIFLNQFVTNLISFAYYIFYIINRFNNNKFNIIFDYLILDLVYF
jgi:hypothetical protein